MVSKYQAEIGAREAAIAAKEAEEDIKTGLLTSAMERLKQAKAEIQSAIDGIKDHHRSIKRIEKNERLEREQKMNEEIEQI